jgi:hypothetical protein
VDISRAQPTGSGTFYTQMEVLMLSDVLEVNIVSKNRIMTFKLTVVMRAGHVAHMENKKYVQNVGQET